MFLRHALPALAAGFLLGACAAPPAPPESPIGSAQQVFMAADGARLPMRSFPAVQPAKAVLIALHGFNDHSGFIQEPAAYLAQVGIETMAYDQRGFGLAPDRGQWAGTQVLVDDFLAVVRDVRRRHPGVPVFVLGESMGAAVISVALAQRPDVDVAGAILVTPAIWSRDTMPWYQRFGIWIGAGLVPQMTVSSSAFAIPPSDNAEMQAEFLRDPLTIKQTRLYTLDGLADLMDQAMLSVPRVRTRALLLYGLRDVMIPRRPMIALFERWPQDSPDNFRFGLYPEGHHVLMRDLQRQVVWRDLESWMLRPEAVLPSGYERERREVLRALRAPRA
jgi:alpha-beta hydrolase superfamily lysophospholipase